jgi:hypothetical protein
MTDELVQKTEEQQQETPKQEEKCPDCELIVPTLVMMATARAACEFVDDPNKKGECISWSENIDPNEIQNAKAVCKEIWKKTGAKGFDGVAAAFNNTMREALIEGVDEMLAAGIQPDEESRRLYAIFTKKKVI